MAPLMMILLLSLMVVVWEEATTTASLLSAGMMPEPLFRYPKPFRSFCDWLAMDDEFLDILRPVIGVFWISEVLCRDSFIEKLRFLNFLFLNFYWFLWCCSHWHLSAASESV